MNESVSVEEVVDLEKEEATNVNEGSDSTNTFWQIDDREEEKEEEEVVSASLTESENGFEVPCYSSKFTGFLTEKEFSMVTGEHIKNDCAPKRTCFNCLGDHNISECTVRKNYQAIARNRMNILGKKTASVRYHEEGENRFSQFTPGVFSENLRNALRLKDCESPGLIYRMRVLGYPPGWLKEAEVKRSTVTLIDGCGKAMIHPDDEEGETDMCLVKYQPEKLISFPGFNVPFLEHIRDDHRTLNFPPMQEHHTVKSFLKFMKLNKVGVYKKKKLQMTDTPNSKPHRLGGDMDVENSEETDAVIEVGQIPTEEKGKEEGEVSEDSNECEETPESTSDNSAAVVNDNLSLKRSLEGESSTDSSKVKRHHRSSSIGCSLGVCIPESITPFGELPEPSKWGDNISDHILFDNLPDSLGTWQKMKGIVKTVKEKLVQINATNE